MKVVTVEEMRSLDHYCIERLGIPSIVLMERAALDVLKHIDMDSYKKFMVICGVGNNGGDGLAIARGLIAEEKEVTVYLLSDPEKGTEDFKTNLNILKKLDVEIKSLISLQELEAFSGELLKYDYIVDAIFGTGLSREVKNNYAIAIDSINESRVYTMSVDIPSGINGDTGKVLGTAIDADEVVSLQFLKRGIFNNPYIRGLVHVESLGMPRKAIEAVLGQEGGTDVEDLVDFRR